MRIKNISAETVLDSRKDETVKARVTLSSGVFVSASVPQGKSRGAREAASLPPARASAAVEGEIAGMLCSREWESAEEIDRALIALDGTANKSRLGANAILAVSVVVARAQAEEDGIPLWRHVQGRFGETAVTFPLLFINMVEGGVHSGSGLLIQEFLVIPKSRIPRETFEIGKSFYKVLGEELGKRFGKIELGDEGGYAPRLSDEEEPFRIFDSVRKSFNGKAGFEYGYDAAATQIASSNEALFELHTSLARKFPVSFIEDPFGEEEFEAFARLRRALAGRALVAGDDLTVTNEARMKEAEAHGAVSAVIIKPNQIGTLTEAISAARLAETFGWKVVVSHRSGETEDDWLADFAVGVGAHGVKFGAPSRPERLAKFARLLAIEKERA